MSSSQVQTLANSIIGTAILAMPFCFSKCGVILSILLLVASTLITRSCCHYLIKASIVTRRRNMEQLGFQMFGQPGKTMVELSVIGFLMGTCIAFFVVIGDLSPLIVSKVFNTQSFSHDSVRKFLIILITITCVIPLCFQKSIDSLSFVCRASIGFYVCLTLKTVFESVERFESDSHWLSNIDLWNWKGVLQCLPIFSMAMSCQMQLFEVYETMGFPASFDRIKNTVHHATSICCIVYCVVGFFGYLAFYNQTMSGNILMNFKPSIANDAITIGFILSIACSFPLVIFPCKAALASFLHKKNLHPEFGPYVPESKYKPLTLFIIFTTMIIGICTPSVEVIISLVGSTIGVLVCILFPATCFVKIMKRNSIEKTFAQMIIVVGFVIMILGTYANLIAIDTAQSGSHLEEKLSLPDPLIEHPKDTHNVHKEEPKLPVFVEQIEETVKKKEEMPVKKIEIPEVKISEDGIKKEDQEIAEEKVEKPKDPIVEIQQKDEEIQELKESKDKLEKEVQEMKEELVKQNKETQQLVLQKFDEIVEKVEKIEKQSLENGPSAKEKEAEKEKFHKDKKLLEELVKIIDDAAEPVEPKDPVRIAEASVKRKETPVEKEKVEDNQVKVNQIVKVESAPLVQQTPESLAVPPLPKENIAKDESIQSNVVADLSNEPNAEHKASIPETRVDPIVKLIQSQEPLSYQLGEKLMEVKKTSNFTAGEAKALDGSKPESTEIKNEMRKKRETFDEALNSLDQTIQNFEFKSMISRDLKAVNEET